MPKPRTPTNVLALKGSFKKDPQRARPAEPEPTASLGSAPKHFDDEHKKTWNELKRIYKLSAPGNSDRLALEALTCLTVQFRNEPAEFSGAKYTRMISLIGLFGGTPSDRSKVSVVKKKPLNNDFSDF